jgi:cell division protein YceG involved in septum cleavage
MNDPRAAVVGLFFGVLVGFVLGAIFYEWWYNSGLKMVLTAQQILVAIDTEHNTREIAEALRRSQTVKS